MNIIDLIIIISAVFVAYRWYQIGLARNLFAVVGLFVGLVTGLFIAPFLMSLLNDSVGKFAGAILSIGLITLLFGTLGEAIGVKLNIRLQSKTSQKINSILGSIGGIIFMLVFIWLASAIIVASPFKAFNNQLENSAIIQFLNRRLPPTPPIIDRVSVLTKPFNFPQVFSGVPQKLSEPVAPAGSIAVQEAVQNAGKSTVKIEAKGCGNTLSTGSGFIAGEGLVMTNAHVVAGASAIDVIDTNGTYVAVPVYFDPAVDIAILNTPKLSAKTLNISTNQFSRGQEAVVLGFPGGGNFKAEPAGITNTIFARGLDIYGQKQVKRDVYEFIGNVIQGNSGGPLVLRDGTVIGMVFASSQNNQGYGYALTGAEISTALKQINQNGVSTQSCYQ